MQPFDWSSKSEMTRNTMRDTKLFGDVETRQRRCIKVTKDGRVTLSPSLGVEVQFSESRSSLLPRAHSEPVQKLMSQGDELAEGLSRAFAKVSIRDVLFGDSQDVREGEEEDALDDALDAIVTECTKRMPRTDIEALTPVRPVGIGGQGGVWLAQDPGTRMKYAVKQFSKSRLSNLTKKAALRAINERECLMDLGYHPFIVTCYASFQTSSSLFLVLELCPGGDMFELVSNYALEEGHARFYISCITLALRHMHVNGWHYRDIKRENVLIDCDGYAKLCDFGFATKVRLCEARGSFHAVTCPRPLSPVESAWLPPSSHKTSLSNPGLLWYRLS